MSASIQPLRSLTGLQSSFGFGSRSDATLMASLVVNHIRNQFPLNLGCIHHTLDPEFYWDCYWKADFLLKDLSVQMTRLWAVSLHTHPLTCFLAARLSTYLRALK